MDMCIKSRDFSKSLDIIHGTNATTTPLFISIIHNIYTSHLLQTGSHSFFLSLMCGLVRLRDQQGNPTFLGKSFLTYFTSCEEYRKRMDGIYIHYMNKPFHIKGLCAINFTFSAVSQNYRHEYNCYNVSPVSFLPSPQSVTRVTLVSHRQTMILSPSFPHFFLLSSFNALIPL